MTKDAALKLALEALDGDHIDRAYAYIQEALAQPVRSDCAETGVCIRSGLYVSALAQPMLEPKAWWDAKLGVFDEKHFDQLQPLYTSPPQRQPLTDEQDRALCEASCNDASDEYFKARPALDFPEMRRIFYAGHRKAWITREAAHGIGGKA
jgi:hypothetical protein